MKGQTMVYMLTKWAKRRTNSGLYVNWMKGQTMVYMLTEWAKEGQTMVYMLTEWKDKQWSIC